MKFLTDKEILQSWFGTSGRFGPANDVISFARQIERLVAKEILVNARNENDLEWMNLRTWEDQRIANQEKVT